MAYQTQAYKDDQAAQAVAMLVAGHSPAEVAKQVGRSVSTIYRWLAKPQFAFRVREARHLELQPHLEALRTAFGAAIAKMLAIMNDPLVAPSVQLRAAVAVAALCLKTHSASDVGLTLAGIEASAAADDDSDDDDDDSDGDDGDDE